MRGGKSGLDLPQVKDHDETLSGHLMGKRKKVILEKVLVQFYISMCRQGVGHTEYMIFLSGYIWRTQLQVSVSKNDGGGSTIGVLFEKKNSGFAGIKMHVSLWTFPHRLWCPDVGTFPKAGTVNSRESCFFFFESYFKDQNPGLIENSD